MKLFLCLILIWTSLGCIYTYDYKTFNVTQKVDHFAFANQDTFQQRILINSDNWDPHRGPIFFYTGNEGDITWFAENSGFMWEIAPQFKAMLVFAEHRYYGESMPYGNLSYSDVKYLGYLTSEQALADFAENILYIKSEQNASDCPVILFGGSYGGMLAAWMRIKYPYLTQGAIAASAPIWQFFTPCNTFNQIVTKDFRRRSPECSKSIRRSWDIFNKYNETDSGRKFLSSTFRLCDSIETAEDFTDFKNWFVSTYGNLAMVEYPYPANFLMPLPAWPIKIFCYHLYNSSLDDKQLLSSLFNAVSVYFNYTGQAKCLDVKAAATASLGDAGWNFQSCTEMVMPNCADGVNDMFEPFEWDFQSFSDSCYSTYKVRPVREMALLNYGGFDIKDASNIVFSNGELDPWSGEGVVQSISDSVIAVMIQDGAHHLDLRSSNQDDPPSVIQARKIEKKYIAKWIRQHKNKQHLK